MIAAIAEKKKFSDHMETTLTAIAGEWFHMIAMIAVIAEVFFFSAIPAITAMVATMWKAGFNLIMAYFKRKDCSQRNLYLSCASL